MRIWSIHPKYLDWKGLGALWRESLLGQVVLLGKTKGWRNHPQLERFKKHQRPLKAIGFFLRKVHAEAAQRGYNYDYSKILNPVDYIETIKITRGQLRYEYGILMDRLKTRSQKKYRENLKLDKNSIDAHPIFKVVEGPPELWEKSYWRSPPKI